MFDVTDIATRSKDLFIKNRSKHSSNTLLSLLRFFLNNKKNVPLIFFRFNILTKISSIFWRFEERHQKYISKLPDL